MQKTSRGLMVSFGLWWILYLTMTECKNSDPFVDTNSQVEVRAVFINCDPDERQDSLDNPVSRFERQEQLKHNALRGCGKKLALTVKMSTDHQKAQKYSDEFIPLDHVFDENHKRIRLLNPYILRLRREPPRQAYKLTRIDTVNGFVRKNERLYPVDEIPVKKRASQGKKNRERRDVDGLESVGTLTPEAENTEHRSYSDRIRLLQEMIIPPKYTESDEVSQTQDCDKIYHNKTVRETHRNKRQKEVRITGSKFDLVSPRSLNVRYYYNDNDDLLQKQDNLLTDKVWNARYDGPEIFDPQKHAIKSIESKERRDLKKSILRFVNRTDHNKKLTEKDEKPQNAERRLDHEASIQQIPVVLTDANSIPNYFDKEFALYEIGDPKLFFDIKVQLFEKLSTPEGKTLWNDMSNGEEARVSSTNPEWTGPNLHVHYQPAEWVSRDEFTLPEDKLALLTPLDNATIFDDQPLPAKNRNIVVPLEDVVYVSVKSQDNGADVSAAPPKTTESDPHRVEVHISRAIPGSKMGKFDVVQMNGEQYLTLPHRRPHHSQIDVEARADDNQLVRIGSSGRLSTVVTDNTRKTRTTVHYQATNTGLTSARFKTVIRDCGPELSSLLSAKGTDEIVSEPVLLPPQHTRRLKLEIPVEVPVDSTHCNVALVNDFDETVAVREATIKKGDRCFCVWHCGCVCLSDDPKLLCREMSHLYQTAAGLSAAERPRRTRCVCYNDCVIANLISTLLCMSLLLLTLGFIKAVLGLCSVRIGQLFWDWVMESPRILDHYYECSLRDRCVIYLDGWPVHPDTMKPVRVLNLPMGFLLNTVIFFILPCIAFKKIINCTICPIYRRCLKKSNCFRMREGESQVCNSGLDLQGSSLEFLVRKKRRITLRDWMTPCAKELVEGIEDAGLKPLNPRPATTNEPDYNFGNETQPLLHELRKTSEDYVGSNGLDSEQEDTDYVLMQMQKSRESLAKIKKSEQSEKNSSRKSQEFSKGKGDNIYVATASKQ